MTTGAVQSTAAEKRAMAAGSVQWNLTHGGFKAMFPELEEQGQGSTARSRTPHPTPPLPQLNPSPVCPLRASVSTRAVTSIPLEVLEVS